MNKELEALNHLVNLAVNVGFREKVFTSKEIILQALKRNEPVKLQTRDDDDEYVEAESDEDYSNDEWWLPMGYCPICGEQNPISNNFCGACGKALERIK